MKWVEGKRVKVKGNGMKVMKGMKGKGGEG